VARLSAYSLRPCCAQQIPAREGITNNPTFAALQECLISTTDTVRFLDLSIHFPSGRLDAIVGTFPPQPLANKVRTWEMAENRQPILIAERVLHRTAQ
jgi:hypothetical protein